jgi:hypothetical protein
LEHLAAQGMLRVAAHASTLHYDREPVLQPIVEALLRVYDESRLELMSIMSSNAIDRVRTGALRAFANAFVLSRKRDDG